MVSVRLMLIQMLLLDTMDMVQDIAMVSVRLMLIQMMMLDTMDTA